ncbi:hypothetical protein JCM8097_004026 [Rhodosporidiobolus ruineniae]
MSSPSPLLLLAISHTLLLALLVPLLTLSTLLYRAGHRRAFFPTASTAFVVLAGLVGLVTLGTGSSAVAVVGGVLGALAMILLDVHFLLVLWRRAASETKLKKPTRTALAGVLSFFFFATYVLHIALLCLDSPPPKTLVGAAVARTVVHIVLSGLTVVLFLFDTVRELSRTRQSVVEDGKSPLKGDKIESLHQTPAAYWLQQRSSVACRSLMKKNEVHLAVLQLLAVLLDIFSVAFALHPSYTRFADGRRAPPTLLGTTISPAGYLTVSFFIAMRWTGVLIKTVGSPPPKLDLTDSFHTAQSHHLSPPSPISPPGPPSPPASPLTPPRSPTRRSSLNQPKRVHRKTPPPFLPELEQEDREEEITTEESAVVVVPKSEGVVKVDESLHKNEHVDVPLTTTVKDEQSASSAGLRSTSTASGIKDDFTPLPLDEHEEIGRERDVPLVLQHEVEPARPRPRCPSSSTRSLVEVPIEEVEPVSQSVVVSPAFDSQEAAPASDSGAETAKLTSESTLPSALSSLSTSPITSLSPVPSPRRSSTSASASTFFGSSLRRLGLKALTPSAAETAETRQSTGSDLSFACRGSRQSVSDLGRAVAFSASSNKALGEVDTAGESGEKEDPVDHVAGPAELAVGQQDDDLSSERIDWDMWWKHLVGSRFTTPYYQSDSAPRLSRSASCPAFSRLSVATASSASEFSLDPARRSTIHEPVARLSAYQLAPPAIVSPFGSLLVPTTPTSSHNSSTSSPASLVFPLPPFQTHLCPPTLFRSSSSRSGKSSCHIALSRQPSAVTSRLSFVTARTRSSSFVGGPGSGGDEVLAEEHLSELDELVRTFSPGFLSLGDDELQWPAGHSSSASSVSLSSASSSSFDHGADDGRGSFEFSEHSLSDGVATGIAGAFEPTHRQHRTAERNAVLAQFDLDSDTTDPSPVSPIFSFASKFSMSAPASADGELVSPITPSSFGSFGEEVKGREGERAEGKGETRMLEQG